MSTLAVGWDLHRKFSQVSLQRREQSGEIVVVERRRLDHADRDAMRQWLKQLPSGTPIAMEGAFGWQWVADLQQELGLEPHLGHPPAIHVLAKNEGKCDRQDADRLGRFWLRGILPESYLSTPAVRQLRERSRYRGSLVQIRAGVKNRVQAILHRLGLLHSFSDLFGARGRVWLAQLELPAGSRAVLDGDLQLIDQLDELIGKVEQWMAQNLVADETTRLLMTLPGVGLILAHVIRAEIGELEGHFASANKLVSYAGLAPLSDDSADRHGRRHVSPYCNHTLKWAFIEATTGLLRSRKAPARLRRLYERLSQRANKNSAHVAVARELCRLTYVIWKKGESYREKPPARPGADKHASRRDDAGRNRCQVRSEQSR
jgi:transposase